MRVRMRLFLGASSQGVTSLSNFLIVIALARTQTPSALGAWALGFAVVTLATTLGRAAIATPIVLSGAPAQSRDVTGGMTISCAAGVATGTVVLILGATGVVPLPIALALGASSVFALIQDFLRYSWIARHQPGKSLVLDLTWLLAQVVGTGVYLVTGGRSAAVLTLIWGASAAVSVAVAIAVDSYARISVRRAKQYWAEYRVDSRRLFQESLANALSANLQPFVVASVVGLAGAGALRVAQTLFAPLTTLIAGLSPVVLRQMSSQLSAGRSIQKIRTAWQVGLGALNFVYGVVIVFLPDSIGTALAGSSWGIVAVLVIPLAVQALIRPQLTIATLTLRAKGRLALLRTASWMFLTPSVLLPALMGALWGIEGAGWGIVLDASIRAVYFAYMDKVSSR